MMKFYVLCPEASPEGEFPEDWSEYELEPWDLPPAGSDYEEAAEKWAEENDCDEPYIAAGNTEEVLVISQHDIDHNPGKDPKELSKRVGVWGEYQAVYYTNIKE